MNKLMINIYYDFDTELTLLQMYHWMLRSIYRI